MRMPWTTPTGGQARPLMAPIPSLLNLGARLRLRAPFSGGGAMRDHLAACFDFPDAPDWRWLRLHWPEPALLVTGARLEDLARAESGRLACLASPYADFEGGKALAADTALAWLAKLAEAEVLGLSPAWNAEEARLPAAQPDKISRVAELVVVPPVEGWAQSIEVWQAVCTALAGTKAVYVLEHVHG